MLKIVRGDLFDAKEKYLIHQVNCQGLMGAGVALQVARRFPHVKQAYVNGCKMRNAKDLLGCIQIVACDPNDTKKQGQCIINLFGQDKIGRGKMTDYDALRKAFFKINQLKQDVAIPYLLGCDLAGGDWNIVSRIIEEECKDINVVAYDLKGLYNKS